MQILIYRKTCFLRKSETLLTIEKYKIYIAHFLSIITTIALSTKIANCKHCFIYFVDDLILFTWRECIVKYEGQMPRPRIQNQLYFIRVYCFRSQYWYEINVEGYRV